MKIVDELKKDNDIQQLKKLYKEKFKKNAPPYNYDEYAGIEDYKMQLKKMIEHPKK